MILDLSDYFMSYLDEMQKGVWSDEYKTRKLVLMDIPGSSFVRECSHFRQDGGCRSTSGKAMILWMIQVETLGPDWH